MTKRFAYILAVSFLIMVGASTALAQHNHSGASPQAAPQAEPVQECQKHHSESLAALDEAAASLANAKQATDPAQMRVAIDSADKQIAAAKHHLNMCPMVQDGTADRKADSPEQQRGRKMKCMSNDSQSK